MQDMVASASSALRIGYEWWQSLGPVGLVGEFLAFVSFASPVLWFTCQNRSPVFWRRTDYAYFVLAILGGIAGAADLAFNNWTKQSEQIQMNMLSNGMLLRGYVTSALLICEKQKAQDKERAQFGPGVINPNKEPNETYYYPWDLIGPGISSLLKSLSARDCQMVDHIWSDIQKDTLQGSVKYGFNYSTIAAKISFFWTSDFDLMKKISLSITQIVDGQAKERAIKEELSVLSYFSILKSLSPILLGLGIGIRLARTHYDVETEKRKARTNVSTAA
jgi:hypothetical protein